MTVEGLESCWGFGGIVGLLQLLGLGFKPRGVLADFGSSSESEVANLYNILYAGFGVYCTIIIIRNPPK